MNFEYEEATEGMERALEALGWGDEPEGDEECACGRLVLYGRELCAKCFHGPEDSDYDPECCGGFSIEVCPC